MEWGRQNRIVRDRIVASAFKIHNNVCIQNSCSTSALFHVELDSVCGSPDGSGRVSATQTTAECKGFGLGVENAAWLGGARGRRGSL